MSPAGNALYSCLFPQVKYVESALFRTCGGGTGTGGGLCRNCCCCCWSCDLLSISVMDLYLATLAPPLAPAGCCGLPALCSLSVAKHGVRGMDVRPCCCCCDLENIPGRISSCSTGPSLSRTSSVASLAPSLGKGRKRRRKLRAGEKRVEEMSYI